MPRPAIAACLRKSMSSIRSRGLSGTMTFSHDPSSAEAATLALLRSALMQFNQKGANLSSQHLLGAGINILAVSPVVTTFPEENAMPNATRSYAAHN